MSNVRRYAVWPDPRSRSKSRDLKLEILQFSKSISSGGIFNVSWQMTTDSETMEQYLNFVRTRFLISVVVFVSRDYELGTKFSCLLTRGFHFWQLFEWHIQEVRTIINKRVQISEESTAVPYGANFYYHIHSVDWPIGSSGGFAVGWQE